MLKMKVKGPRILLKVKKVEEKTSGGIILTEETRDKETTNQTEGEVIGIGDTAYKRKDAYCNGELWCEVGDKVIFSKYGASRIANTYVSKEDEFEYWILMDKDVMLVKTKEDKENV